MMDYKMFAVCLFAIAGSYLVFSMPVAFATDVNIYYNGQKLSDAQISPQNVVSRQIVINHDESDTRWARTMISVNIDTASLAHSIKRVFLYKCKKADPTACVQTEPQSFDNRIRTDIAWADMSEQAGQAAYPQVGNLLILVKLEGLNGRTSWVAFWNTIKRLDYNIFNSYSTEISSIDITAKSADLVGPIQSYISNFQMVPFNWVSRVAFTSATLLYGIGGNSANMNLQKPQMETAQMTNVNINEMNKDFYMIFSNISSGTANALTMNLNPSFTRGDGECEGDLGETQANSCSDCGCLSGQYCDITSGTTGSCRSSGAISLSVTGVVVPTPLLQCTGHMPVNVSVRINNAPSNLPAAISSQFRIGGTLYSVSCAGDGTSYTCPLRLQPPVSCGNGMLSIGPNNMSMTIRYRDGPQTDSSDLGAVFPSMDINYNCACAANFYCDTGPNVCRADGSIMLQVLSVDSYLDNFIGANDEVKSVYRIINTPTNFSVDNFNVLFGNITWDDRGVQAGSSSVSLGAGCVQSGSTASSITFNCSPILNVPSYSSDNSYVVRHNRVNATISFTDAGASRQAVLSAAFGDIVIPQQSCGNGRVDPRETLQTCCRDYTAAGQGCPSGQYCDLESGCKPISDITAEVLSVEPANISDCTVPHNVNLSVRINNLPHEAALNYYSYLRNSATQGWAVRCLQPVQFTGIADCTLTVPPQLGCAMPVTAIGANSLNLSISFRNGDSSTLSRVMNAPFQDIMLTPVWHCGDRTCEAQYGENASNCCIDCACRESGAFGTDYYCNFDAESAPNGICLLKNDIRLVIDSPTSTVALKTCENSQGINLKAHIENQPSAVTPENYFVTVRGENSEVACVNGQILPSTSYAGGWNCVGTPTSSSGSATVATNCAQYTTQAACATYVGCSWLQGTSSTWSCIGTTYLPVAGTGTCDIYTSQSSCISQSGCSWQPQSGALNTFNVNCTVEVPAADNCVKGSSITYSNNTFGVFISYRDGINRVVTQALVSRLPDIRLTQSFKSIQQIIDAGVQKIMDNTNKMIKLMKKLMDFIKMCIYIQIALVMVEMAATVYVGTNGFGNQKFGSIGDERWKNGMMAVGQASTAINSAWGNICQMVEKYYEIMAKTIDIENKLVGMQMCLDVYQHQLDAGMCRASGSGGLTRCFNQITSCVNLGQVTSYMSSIGSDLRAIQQGAANVGQAIYTLGKDMAYLGIGGGGAEMSFAMKYGSGPQQASGVGKTYEVCDRYPGDTYRTASDKDDVLVVTVMKGVNCQTPVVKSTDGLTSTSSSINIPIDGTSQDHEFTLTLYCFASQDEYLRERNDATKMGTYKKDEAKFKVLVDNERDGNCWGGVSGGSGGVSSAVKTDITGARTKMDDLMSRTAYDNLKSKARAVRDSLNTALGLVDSSRDAAKNLLKNDVKPGLVGFGAGGGTFENSLVEEALARVNSAITILESVAEPAATTPASATGAAEPAVTGCCAILDSATNDYLCSTEELSKADCEIYSGEYHVGKTCDTATLKCV